jgi:hypothetical protein
MSASRVCSIPQCACMILAMECLWVPKLKTSRVMAAPLLVSDARHVQENSTGVFHIPRMPVGTFPRVARQLQCTSSRVWSETHFRRFKRSIHRLPVVRSRLVWPGRSGYVRNMWCGHGAPGLRTANLSVQKKFPLSESKTLEFRVAFFNVTNTPILNSPTIWLSPKLGLVDNSQGERNIQFALKFSY